MKILIFFLFLLFGCKEDVLSSLENQLYELDEVYVEMNEDELIKDLNINRSDYEDCISLKSLIFYNEKVIFVFKNPNEYLIHQLNEYKKDGYVVLEFDSFVYYGVNDSKIIDVVNEVLNKD